MEGAGALRFSQTTTSSTFRNEPMAGRMIGDVSSDLRRGASKPGELPVDLISRGGNSLIMNTRSSLALMRGGVPPAEWTINNVTGDAFMESVLSERHFGGPGLAAADSQGRASDVGWGGSCGAVTR